MLPRFSTLSRFTCALCLILAAAWLCTPELLLGMWHIEVTQSALILGRRSAALFFGIALVTHALRGASSSALRTAIADALALAFTALALLGLAELWAGHVGIGILSAAAVELALAAALSLSVRAQVRSASAEA